MQNQLGNFLAQHIQEAFITQNWCGAGILPAVQKLTWQQATQVPLGNHSIAALTFHVQYYLQAICQVLQQQPITVTDAKSFALVPVTNHLDWKALQAQTLNGLHFITKCPQHRMGYLVY